MQQKVGKGRKGKRKEQKGEERYLGRRESSEARARARSLIGRPLNLPKNSGAKLALGDVIGKVLDKVS